MEGFKPLLSAKIDTDSEAVMMEQLGKLSYPLIASPKVDGIRVLCLSAYGPVTRKIKSVPNDHIRRKLDTIGLVGLDGEIIVGAPSEIAAAGLFNSTQSAIMSFDGNPTFTYWVFDDFTNPLEPYVRRLNDAKSRVESLKVDWIRPLESTTVKNPSEVLELEASYLKRGFEGIMLRHPATSYKYGRATLKQQQLIKLKRTEDAEGTVIDTRPLYENQNAPEKDALGHQKRSSHQAGKVETDMLGSLVVQPSADSGFAEHFEIGSGFDDATRSDLWARRTTLVGRIVVFKYQATGVKDKPRFPIFKGFRSD